MSHTLTPDSPAVETMSLLPAALRIAEKRGMRTAVRLDEFGLRACRPDFTSRNGFRWPFPGRWAEAAGPFIEHNDDPCPFQDGDGICVALKWNGMRAGIPAHTVLLVGWRHADQLGRSRSKVRVKRAFVVDVVTVADLLAERLEDERADLQGAYLRGADLQGAYLRGAYLQGAYLRGADLRGAYLRGADLRGAYLRGAYLRGAYLRGADLRGAYLRGADLQGAYLQGAYLQGADLRGALNANTNGAIGRPYGS